MSWQYNSLAKKYLFSLIELESQIISFCFSPSRWIFVIVTHFSPSTHNLYPIFSLFRCSQLKGFRICLLCDSEWNKTQTHNTQKILNLLDSSSFEECSLIFFYHALVLFVFWIWFLIFDFFKIKTNSNFIESNKLFINTIKQNLDLYFDLIFLHTLIYTLSRQSKFNF